RRQLHERFVRAAALDQRAQVGGGGAIGGGGRGEGQEQGGGGEARGHGSVPALGRVRVRQPQAGEDLPLQLFHGLGLLVVLVVPAQQVQGAVHGEVGVVRGQGLALLGRLARHHRRADHQVAQQRELDPLGQAFRQLGR